jgi:hypothetical protein
LRVSVGTPLVGTHPSPHRKNVILFHLHLQVVILVGPTPAITVESADETIPITVDLDERAIAARAGSSRQWNGALASD